MVLFERSCGTVAARANDLDWGLRTDEQANRSRRELSPLLLLRV
jgi:hypothetical protein